jgi:hypothetical protein
MSAGLSHKSDAMSVEYKDGLIELALHRNPCNEIGSQSLQELESFSEGLQSLKQPAHAVIIYSDL